MNAGNTPGYLLKQIESALCRAFPSKTRLEMMLRHQFSQNLEEIARGENLTEIVYKVVQDFNTSNSLAKLIKKALKENPNNASLKAIKEKFEITTSLVNLLLPLEKQIIKPMQQAYSACCYDKLGDNREYEIPDNLNDILENLDNIPQQNDNETPIIEFVARLLITGHIPKPIAEKLKQWLDENDSAAQWERLIKKLNFQQDDLLLDEDGTVLLSENELLPPRHSFDSNWLNELEAPEGTVKLRSKFYLQRENEAKWLDKVLGWGETIRVKGAHQMGKSSLLARMHQQAKQNSQAALYLDFQRFDQTFLSSLDSLLRYIAARMTKHWRTSRSPDSYWSSSLGAKDKLSDFVLEEVLENTDFPILLIFDDVDIVFDYDYRDDFFSLIRAWHNERAIEEQWEKLNLVLAYSTEAFLFIQDLNQSPFNVGISIELGDLSRSKVEEMNRKHNSIARSSGEIDSLINLLGGHPYLLRMAFYTMATGSIRVPEFCRVAGDDDGPFAEHLSRYLRQLEAWPDLRHGMQDVLRKHKCTNNEIFYRLRKSGLILGHSPDAVQARCQLYAQYFETRL